MNPQLGVRGPKETAREERPCRPGGNRGPWAAAGAHLGDDGDLEAQVVQADLGDVHAIDDDLAFC